MINFEDWGTKIRVIPEANYFSVWRNLKTVRMGESVESIKELPPEFSEFYDVGINTKCNAECPFCYVSATGNGINFPNICETWEKWIKTFPEDKVKIGPNGNKVTKTLKPFQIAIGSTGEPTIHPDFPKFLETVYGTGVVPNYTTNGLVLSNMSTRESNILMGTTREFVGGVAVSMGNMSIRNYAIEAIRNLLNMGSCKVMMHHIISDKYSVDDFISLANMYKDIHYHVLLPLMPHGRSEKGLVEGTYEYLEQQIIDNNLSNVAFGANFYPYLNQGSRLPVSTYPQEAYSKNIILNNKVILTKSSFDLKPIRTIYL